MSKSKKSCHKKSHKKKSCHSNKKKSCYKKKSCQKKNNCCCNNPWYTNTPEVLAEYNNINNVSGNTAGTGNVLTKGYGIVYGLVTPNVYMVTNNFN